MDDKCDNSIARLKGLKHQFHRRETSAESLSLSKCLFTKSENLSQNLGCSKTSTTQSCSTEEKDY